MCVLEYGFELSSHKKERLKGLPPIHKSHLQTTPPEVEEKIPGLSLANPMWGCVRLSNQLKLMGISVSSSTIFDSDQGSQFTGENFTGLLLNNGILISMDGRGRVFDNILVERLWHTVKYEEVYLKDYRSVPEAKENLGAYFAFYNAERSQQSLGYATPQAVYLGQN